MKNLQIIFLSMVTAAATTMALSYLVDREWRDKLLTREALQNKNIEILDRRTRELESQLDAIFQDVP